jgi:parallel beta-helix repeat protein
LEREERMMKNRLGLWLACAACMTTSILALAAGQALAAPVQCGQIVTQDVTLESDLLDCPGDGLRIGADSITIDLAGHVIDGSNTGDGIRDAGHQGVTVENGTIQEFSVGVRLESAAGNGLAGLQLTNNRDLAVSLFDASDNHLSGLTAFGNGASTPSGEGILLVSGSDRNVVEGSTFANNGSWAIRITNSSRNRIRYNDIGSHRSAGIVLLGGCIENVIAHNLVNGAGLDGISTGAGNNVGNVLDGNQVSEQSRDGISIQFASATKLIRNDVSFNGADGITVGQSFTVGQTTDTLVQRNRADANGDDGIDTSEPSTTLTANRANRNFDLGIEAVPGVIDGGRNRARGNGNPAQCLNVVCR